MTTREKIIKRLNAGFGLSIPVDTTWVCRQRKYRDVGGFSWCLNYVENIGSSEPASTVLRWRKWAYNIETGEIFEYFESNKDFYKQYNYKYLIETKQL